MGLVGATVVKIHQAYRGGHNGRAGWWLHLEYDEVGVDRLKAIVPAVYRTWDEDQKRWWIALQAEEAAVKVVPGLEAYRRQGSLL